MLKLHALTPALASNLRPGSANSASPLLRAALSSLRGLTRRSSRSSDLVGHRAFFCSDSDSSGDVVVHVEAKAVESEAEEVDTKSSSAIVSTNPRPEDYLTDMISNHRDRSFRLQRSVAKFCAIRSIME
ncbi:lon protease homolog 1, mitochondrial-like [Fagus crenata]